MKKLSREEMKSISGGTVNPQPGEGCCWHGTGWGTFTCGLPKSTAQEWQSQLGGNWCCDSCVTSYNNSIN